MEDWKKMPLTHKIATGISFVLAVLLIVLLVLGKDVLPVDISAPAIMMISLCEAFVYWDKKRKLAYLCIGAAVIVGASFVLELIFL